MLDTRRILAGWFPAEAGITRARMNPFEMDASSLAQQISS
jgi:hypothetical protein